MNNSALRQVSPEILGQVTINTVNDRTKVNPYDPTTWTVFFCTRMKKEFEGKGEIHAIWERRRTVLTQHETKLRNGETVSHPFHQKNARGKDAVLIRPLTEKETRAAYRLELVI